MKNSFLFVALFSVVGLSACYKEQQPKPALSGGECNIIGKGYRSEGQAQSELIRITGILNNFSIGNADLKIIRDQTYVSLTKKGNPDEWGYQVVFSCADAAVYYEYEQFYDDLTMQVALNARLNYLSSLTDGTKVLNYMSGWYDYNCYTYYENSVPYDRCDTGSDYSIQYMKVNKSELQKKMLEAYELYAGTAQTLGFKKPSVEEVLGVAVKVLPNNSDTYKVAHDLKNLLEQVKNPKSRVNKEK